MNHLATTVRPPERTNVTTATRGTEYQQYHNNLSVPNTPSVFLRVEHFFDSLVSTLESILLNFAARFGPWLAPIGPAYFVGRAAYLHLEAHIAIATAMALAVEAVGIASTHTALKAWVWNESRTRKIDPKAPFALMVWLSLFYFISAVILSIVVEVYPAAATYAPAIFIGLAAVAYVTIAVSYRLKQWEALQAQEALEKAAKSGLQFEIAALQKQLVGMQEEYRTLTEETVELERKKAQLARQQVAANGVNAAIKSGISPLTQTSIATANQGKQQRIETRRNKVQEYKQQDLSNAEIARLLNVSPDTISRDVRALNGAVAKG